MGTTSGQNSQVQINDHPNRALGYILLATVVVTVVILVLGRIVSVTQSSSAAQIAQIAVGIATAIGVGAAVAAGFFAKDQLEESRRIGEATLKQLEASKNIALGEFVLHWDERFRSAEHIAISHKIRDKSAEDSDWQSIINYLRLFERIYLMIETGIVRRDFIARAYGYRIHQIQANEWVNRKIMLEQSNHDLPCGDFVKLCQCLGGANAMAAEGVAGRAP